MILHNRCQSVLSASVLVLLSLKVLEGDGYANISVVHHGHCLINVFNFVHIMAIKLVGRISDKLLRLIYFREKQVKQYSRSSPSMNTYFLF